MAIQIEAKLPETLYPDYFREDLSEHEQLCLKLGCVGAAFQRTRILRILQKNEIAIYTFSKVWEFLCEEAKKQGKNPYWFPARQGQSYQQIGDSMSRGWPEIFMSDIYSKPIPMHALRKIDTVLQEIPEAQFYVSDYVASKPDPFLLLLVPFVEPLVIDHWDEPSFKLNS